MTKFLDRKLYCIALLVLCSYAGFGQGYDTTKWRFSNPKQFGITALDVDFFDNNNGLAVGNEGIAKTTDGGKNWSYGPFTYVNAAGLLARGSFNDVHYVTSTIAYATGSLGLMAKTTDGGLTWNFVNTPLFANSRNINAVWFVDQNVGYIGGQWNTPDSIPKLYRTTNGGATWDSLTAPVSNGTSRVGYINNPNYPPIDLPIDAKVKEIQRIQFSSTGVGYISGGGFSHFPSLGIPTNASTTNCVGTGTAFTTTSHNASLLWKFENGVLTDYSISKERLGYTGYPAAAPFNCSQKYANVNQTVQQFRAFNIINDTLIVMMSFNNNVVVKVRTGRNDLTENINRPGVFEKGVFEILNTGFSGTPFGYPSVPLVQVLAASNPYHMKRASNGKLYACAGAGALWTSVDTGRNWVRENSRPQGMNYSAFNTWAFTILPSGKFITMGAGGVVADSIPGGTWQSNYVLVPAGGTDIDFADCANGMATGGGSIAVTTDGGTTWIDKGRPDFTASFYNINGFSYATLNKAWFAVSNGVIYLSPDKGTTLDPSYSDGNFQMNDVQGIGNDTVYAVGYSTFTIPAASRKSTFFRSVNGGLTWTTVDIALTTTTPAFTAPTIQQMTFPSRNVGYVAGSRNAVYKTTDGGTTWTNISPFPSLNAGPAGFPNTFITYSDIFAIDDNTVIVIGNMFTSAAVKRVYKTTDGGATWVDITSNIPSFGSSNIMTVMFHDANNGYVGTGSFLFKTTDGGTSWSVDISPGAIGFTTMAFPIRKMTTPVSFANRKVLLSGVANGPIQILEYGNNATVNVNATTAIVNTNCGSPSGGSIAVTASGGTGPYTYSINGGTFQTSNVFNGLTAGVKTITVKDAYCGITTKQAIVTFVDNLTLTANNDTTVCVGAPVQLQANSIAGATFAWSPSAGLSNAAIANPLATITGPVTYTVTATLGTCVKTEPVVISTRANPVISAGSDKTILAGDQVMLNGTASNAANISWAPAASLTGSNTLTPMAKPAATTTYTLTVRNTDNCTSTDDVIVTVIPICVNVMNAFSPNGDGINDLWKVTSGTSCTNQISVAVYNRYGNEVYKNANYNNDWNGQYNGKPVADGTYYYRVTLKLLNGTTTSLAGDVTILR